MGIEPTGKTVPNLENKRFCEMADAKCDWRVNFHGMWGNLRLRRDASESKVPSSSLSRRSPAVPGTDADLEVLNARM